MGVTERQTRWGLARSAIYASVLVWAAIFPLMLPIELRDAFGELDEVFTATSVVVGLGAVVVFFAVTGGMLLVNFHLQRTLGNLPDPLVAPSHHRHPFRWTDQWEFWHFGGWLMLSGGAGSIVAGLWSTPLWLIVGVLGLGLGATVLVSMRIFMWLNAAAQLREDAE